MSDMRKHPNAHSEQYQPHKQHHYHSQPHSQQNCQQQPQFTQFHHQAQPSQSLQHLRQEQHSQLPHLQPTSPERHLAALPDSFIGSSTPQCHCHIQLHQYQLSPCTPSSSLLSFSDSSASRLSEQSQPDDTTSPRTSKQLSDDRRRLRLMQREESRLEQLVTDLDSRLRIANAPAALDGAGKNTELLALQQMSAQSFLRTVQMYVAAKSEQVVAAAASTNLVHQRASSRKCGSMLWSGSDSSGSDDCSLLDN